MSRSCLKTPGGLRAAASTAAGVGQNHPYVVNMGGFARLVRRAFARARGTPGISRQLLNAALLLSVLGVVAAYGQGHTIAGNKVVVDRQAHWQQWTFPGGTLDIDETGTVRPHFVPKNTLATSDIAAFIKRGKGSEDATLRDALSAGTRAADLAHLLDGDLSTYWEPDPASPLRQWWFEIDLGRLVAATHIRLTFVGEELGDPFLQFVILTSDGAEVTKGQRRFNQVFRTLKSNKDQREFEIELDPTRFDREGRMVSDYIRFVRLTITDTDSTRAAEVSAEQYDQLAAADQGAVDFYKKAGAGQVQVSEATYEVVDSALRGEIRRYRRERPRLAELEVQTLGENISLGLVERRGAALLTFLDNAPATAFFDGIFETSLAFTSTDEIRELFFDLGSSFWIDRHQIYYDRQRSRFPNYDLQTSDGSLAADGSLVWTTQASRRNRATSGHYTGDVYDVDTFAPTRTRFARILFWGGGQFKPREVQFYGEGFQPEVELVSPLIRLGSSKNLVSVEWDGDADVGTFIEIQTRTGSELVEEYSYFNSGGAEVSAEAYAGLGFFSKGRIDTTEVPGGDWSAWSLPYEASGAAITSPSPRQFLELKARLVSDDPHRAAELRSIRLNFVEPLARQLLGEIEPSVVGALGKEQELSLFIKPSFAAQSAGFDEVQIRAPDNMALEFRGLRLGREAQWESAELVASAEVVATAPDSLWVRLSEVVSPSAADLIEVQFATALYLPGAVFKASLGHSALENSWQRVDPADATELATGQGMLLVGPEGGRHVLGDLSIDSGVATPNGDGVNDELAFSFAVTKLTGTQPLHVRIYDLAGRLVRHWQETRPLVSGEYALRWSCEDQSGALVAPGMYLLEVEVVPNDDSRVERTARHRLVHVVY